MNFVLASLNLFLDRLRMISVLKAVAQSFFAWSSLLSTKIIQWSFYLLSNSVCTSKKRTPGSVLLKSISFYIW